MSTANHSTRGQRVLAALLDDPALAGARERGELQLAADESMARHTTLRLGGPADVWARPSSPERLSQLLRRAYAAGVPVTFVGSGTNLLVRDGGVRGVVINIGRMTAVTRPDAEHDPGHLEVAAGVSTGRLLRHSLDWSLGGIEFLGGVPGSVGGGLIMNAGTYLGEFTDVVTEVRSIRRDGQPVTRDHDACGFRYRASDLPPDEVVIGATLQLTPRARGEIETDVRGLRTRRKEREPSGVANSGSTFKNPEGDYAGRLIDVAGLKGTRIAGAVVSPKHANWLVVERGQPCTARDLLQLVDIVRERVLQVHGVALALELKIIGDDA